MPFPDELLTNEERVLVRRHPHWHVLLGPIALIFLVIIGVAVAGYFWPDYALWITLGGLALALITTIAPFVQWRCEWFVVTTRHIFFRKGVFSRRSHQIPLRRIQDIESNDTFIGRILGYGTLSIDSASGEPLTFMHVSRPAHIQRQINDLIAELRDEDGEIADEMR